jgi:serine/threonine-protein kinase
MNHQPKDQLIGKNLGQYTILEEVGRGGMATVYRARQASMNRTVAIKVLPPALMHDPGFFERFQREVDVIADLEHPHILPVYDYGHFEGMPFIVMRYLGGGSLAQMIRRGPPPVEQLERPISQVAAALDYAHQKGIIHRDIKPGNIMLDDYGNAYLSDFGIARVVGSNMTGSAVIGTPAYMSPEQATGAPIDGRSDIYALGIVLFELLTGREPYQAETPMALLLKHINEPMPEARSFRADLARAIDSVIVIATAKDPADRFSSASDMARAFGDAVRNPDKPLPTHLSPKSAAPGTKIASPTRAENHHTPASTMAVGQDIPTIAAEAPAPRSRLPLIIGGLIAAAVVVIGAIFVLPLIMPPPAPLPAPTATLCADCLTFRHPTGLYTLNVPQDWEHYDLTPGQVSRDVHVWQISDLSAYVGVSVVNGTIASEEEFATAIASYYVTYVEPQLDERNDNVFLNPLDEATAPDGSLRRSYRLERSLTPPFPSGQVDHFYLWRGNRLVVVETYTADTTASALVPAMQSILDSLQVSVS